MYFFSDCHFSSYWLAFVPLSFFLQLLTNPVKLRFVDLRLSGAVVVVSSGIPWWYFPSHLALLDSGLIGKYYRFLLVEVAWRFVVAVVEGSAIDRDSKGKRSARILDSFVMEQTWERPRHIKGDWLIETSSFKAFEVEVTRNCSPLNTTN